MKTRYEVRDSWDWVTHFETEVSNYTGHKHGIACDSNSNAIRLILYYLGIEREKITIPKNTYVSVPNQIILSGNTPVFEDITWEGLYVLGGVPIVDAATGFWENMGSEYREYFMILSFHLKKIIKIGKGGMILTNDDKFEKWSRPMIYDGRHKEVLYSEDEFECIGWHMYMTPEEAKKGLMLFNEFKNENNPTTVCGGSNTYKDISKFSIFNNNLTR